MDSMIPEKITAPTQQSILEGFCFRTISDIRIMYSGEVFCKTMAEPAEVILFAMVKSSVSPR